MSIPAVMVLWAFVRAGWQSLQANCSPMVLFACGRGGGAGGCRGTEFLGNGIDDPGQRGARGGMAAVVVHVPSRTVPEGR